MLSEAVRERLATLHPEGTAELGRINELAQSATDSALLELCAGYIDCALQDRAWTSNALSAKEKAYLAFTEQFVTSVSNVTDEQVNALLAFSTADEVYAFVNALYVVDMSRRLDLVAGRVLV